MHDVAIRVGRLLEVRFGSPFDLSEVEAFSAGASRLAHEQQERLVSCVDMRSLRTLPPPVADAFVALLRDSNPRIERTACLLPEESATLRLQIERLHRGANNPARRAFEERATLERWLGEVLRPRERERLAAFLDA